MCGIAGIVNYGCETAAPVHVMEKMTQRLAHRGPDDSGSYTDRHVMLGHRRLVIIDPAGGCQPMQRSYGGSTYTIVYNGELYNTEDLRASLLEEGFSFQSY